MKILGIYNNSTQKYVVTCLQYLADKGLDTQAIAIEEYTGKINVTSTPLFLVEKFGTHGYPLLGKQTLHTLENWAIQIGALCN